MGGRRQLQTALIEINNPIELMHSLNLRACVNISIYVIFLNLRYLQDNFILLGLESELGKG
jgi:hypothetical protein